MASSLSSPKNSQLEYFVSYCVMTEGANPMGHGFMLISQLDHKQGDGVKVEVISALGMYSRYMPVLGFKPYGVAKIKLEDMAYIANAKGMVHETYQVTEQDVETLLDIFYQDKLKIEQHDDATDYQATAVPMFNIFQKKNCKKYVLDSFKQIGINTEHLNSFMEIPILNSLETMVISESQENEFDKTYYWGSPIAFKAKSDAQDDPELNKTLQQNYANLYHTYARIQKLLTLIQARQAELASLGKRVKEISAIEIDLTKLSHEIENLSIYPKLIKKEDVLELACKLTFCVDEHISNLEKKQLEPNLICILKDVLQELLLYVKHLFSVEHNCSDAALNTMDKEVFDKIHTMDAQMREQNKEKDHASDLLSANSFRRAGIQSR